MSGVEISKKSKLLWVGISVGALAVSVGLGIGVGPKGVYLASGAGVLAAGVALVVNRQQLLAVLLIISHIVLLGIGVVLDSLFLQPLSETSLQMPYLSQKYIDPSGFFEVRAPSGWITETIHSPTEAGVRLRPADRQQYMGVSELTVRIRELEKEPKKPADFLAMMAKKLSTGTDRNRTLFEFSTQPAELMNGRSGMWSKLVLKRFWIPLYQTALFGIKDRRFLCSVSTSGLKNHGTLSEVLCLGVFESIRLRPKPVKTR